MANLLELCKNLKAENEAPRIENDQLKGRLGLNSKNSPVPSSKELYKFNYYGLKSKD